MHLFPSKDNKLTFCVSVEFLAWISKNSLKIKVKTKKGNIRLVFTDVFTQLDYLLTFSEIPLTVLDDF